MAGETKINKGELAADATAKTTFYARPSFKSIATGATYAHWDIDSITVTPTQDVTATILGNHTIDKGSAATDEFDYFLEYTDNGGARVSLGTMYNELGVNTQYTFRSFMQSLNLTAGHTYVFYAVGARAIASTTIVVRWGVITCITTPR